jgi:hypothetical protein
MNSPGHRENILNPAYREIGIGIAVGNPARDDGAGATYATEFGVIEGAAALRASVKKAKKAKKSKRGARKAKARAARHGRKGERGRRGANSRGPKARIAI